MIFPSKLIENAVEELAKLPGIGRKTALRLVLHLLKAETEVTEKPKGELSLHHSMDGATNMLRGRPREVHQP